MAIFGIYVRFLGCKAFSLYWRANPPMSLRASTHCGQFQHSKRRYQPELMPRILCRIPLLNWRDLIRVSDSWAVLRGPNSNAEKVTFWGDLG